jgi:hypothetical protein
MSKTNTGGTVFPVTRENREYQGELGMTLRDYFAAKALPIAAAREPHAQYDVIAEIAYDIADEMLYARGVE